MESTHALSIDIALTERAAEDASASGLSDCRDSSAGSRADEAAAADIPENGFQLELFGEEFPAKKANVPAQKTPRKRNPQADGAPQPSTVVPSATAEVDPESTRSAGSPSLVSYAPKTPAAAETPCEQRSDSPKDDASDMQIDPQNPSLWTSVPTFDLRGDDFKIESFASLVEPYPNDLKIYRALLRLADVQKKGTRVDDETWKIRIGYSDICKESRCCKRALGRAWPRLERLGVVVCKEKHKDRVENLYTVRTPEWLERQCQKSGCTHFRFVEGMIQPFRQRSEGEK